jgi:hypothetical protein
MGKALKKRQKWRNLDISPAPIIHTSREEKEEEGSRETSPPFLKIISKNLDVLITKEGASVAGDDVSSPPPPPAMTALPPSSSGPCAASASDRVKFFYRSDRIPVFDPANCTVVGTAGSGLDPVSTAMFVGDPLRYAAPPHQSSGPYVRAATFAAQNSHFVQPPPPSSPLSAYETSPAITVHTAAGSEQLPRQSLSSMSSSK